MRRILLILAIVTNLSGEVFGDYYLLFRNTRGAACTVTGTPPGGTAGTIHSIPFGSEAVIPLEDGTSFTVQNVAGSITPSAGNWYNCAAFQTSGFHMWGASPPIYSVGKGFTIGCLCFISAWVLKRCLPSIGHAAQVREDGYE